MLQDADGRADPAEIAGALADLARWLQTAQGDEGWLAALRFGVAGALVQAGEGALAEAGFRRILSDSPGHLWSWIALIDLALARGDAVGAMAIGQAGLIHLPQDALLRRKTAEAVEQADSPSAALAVLQGGSDGELNPDDLHYAIALHRAAQSVDLAEPFCAALLMARPGDALALLAMIEAKLKRGDGPGAVAAGQAALDQHPAHSEIRLRAAQAHLMAGDPDRAKALAHDAGDATGFADAFRAVLAQIAGADTAPAPDSAALMGDLAALLAKGTPPDATAVLIAGIRACRELPWYGAIALVAEAMAKGACALAEQISAACADAPWETADRQAFAIEDALLRQGPRAALDWVAAHPTAHRDAEAAERIGRVLVQAGTGALAARYLGRCCRRWPGEGALLERATEALIACGAADRVGGLCDTLPPGPMVGAARLRAGLALGTFSAAQTPDSPALIEMHLLAGDLDAAEDCLARLSTTDGPLAEALICRPRATRLGSILNEARVLAAMGIDWMADDPATLADLAPDMVLPARRLIALWRGQTGAAPGATGPRLHDLVHLAWPAPDPDSAEGAALTAIWASQTRRQVVHYDPTDAPGWLRAHHGPEVDRAYRSERDPEQKADLWRLARLKALGGVAVGAPQWPGEALDPWIDPVAGAVFFCDGAGAVTTDLMAAGPGHPVIAAALEMAVAACLAREKDHRWLKTGPGLMTRAMARVITTGPHPPGSLRPEQWLRRRVHP